LNAVPFARPIPLRRFRLGAEELIEMGDSRRPARADRRPFLGDGARISLGAEELIEMGQPVAVPGAVVPVDTGPSMGTVFAVGLIAAGVVALALAL
jgi:hypothetical protein